MYRCAKIGFSQNIRRMNALSALKIYYTAAANDVPTTGPRISDIDNTGILCYHSLKEEDLMTGGVTQMYDAMMTGSGIEHDFYTTAGGHDFATWSDGLHTFVNNIFGAGASA